MPSPVQPFHGRLGTKTLVMGIVNVTPDSFYDGGGIQRPADALALARQMIQDGADILDIGGESSRPGAAAVSPDEELARVEPVFEALRQLDFPMSADTCRAATAKRALALGACVINDITALTGDPEMAGVVAEAQCDCVLMHMQGTPKTMQRAPRYDDIVDDIRAFFEECVTYAVSQGIAERAIWLDPGFGFGKTVAHNLALLRRLHEFKELGRPLLVGTSNKSTIGEVLGLPIDERTEGTAATVAIAIRHGADCIRVHDVKAMARVAKITDAILEC